MRSRLPLPLSVLAAAVLCAGLVPRALQAGDEALAVRMALVVGNRGESPLPRFGEVLSDRLLADYLTQWDPDSDNPEIRKLFALRGLSEVTRQAARLQPAGGTLAGTARIGAVTWRVEVDVAPGGAAPTAGSQPAGEQAHFRARIWRGEELVSAPQVRSLLGQKAIVSTTNDEDGTFLFLIVQADAWSAVASRLPASGPAAVPEPARPIPKVLTKVNPAYPESERAERRQGVVVLALRVDAQGVVSDARVVKSLAPAFDEAALTAVRQWRFEPVRRNGEAVESEINITINFVPG